MNKARNNVDSLSAITEQEKQLKNLSIVESTHLQNNDRGFVKLLNTSRRRLTRLVKYIVGPVFRRYRRYMNEPVHQYLPIFEQQLIETRRNVEKIEAILLQNILILEGKFVEPHKKLEKINELLLQGKHQLDKITPSKQTKNNKS